MKHALLLSLLVGRLAVAGEADDAYAAAKTAYVRLKADPRQRTLRHHWQRVIRQFEKVASSFPRSDRAPEALFMAGQAASQLYRLSSIPEDRARTQAAYERLIRGWPGHRLADDAVVDLAGRFKGDRDELRRMLLAVRPGANDKKREIDRLAKELGPPPAPAGSTESRIVRRPARARTSPRLNDAARDERRSDPVPVQAPREPTIAEAIQRAVGPLAAVTVRPEVLGVPGPPEPEPSPQARPLEQLTETLRNVRVGERPPSRTERAQTARLRALARSPAVDLSLAQQLGLKMRRIVIDPGHGGHDTGAIGPSGVEEKEVALAISLKVQDRLRDAGLEVVLTRDDDRFIPLEKRVALANEAGADLFLSIHCNAAESNRLRGVETYSLNTASSRYAVRLAARENAGTQRGVGDLRYVLADLATKANTQESQALASRIQRSLVDSLSAGWKDVRDLGTKEALFLVLLGARMPAVLVETSFLSNPEEEKRLGDETYQDAVAGAVADAVVSFVEARETVRPVE